MKRVDIVYNGTAFTVSNRTVEEFQAEVDAALAAPVPQWLTVNHGEGRANAARILITPFTALTIITNDFDDQNRDRPDGE
ncbi:MULTISPECIES: hypothetical protein [unclassified Rathayibacter]|uniref:hypothetical protein n=1 Tax=unclassified Rathayibacter TaxID=2609250 RepID=UPI0006F4A18C|nr:MULTISPECIES: hypothetical protein [unclassified Rathayibacter]KQQ03426.1 hypothetical protein ASF42_07845 [Rathayibacter sp. Leaf294]KQS11882.1 hypothetical protein ASG06_07845 [Rathayibacter sp. Leaf185]